MSELKIMVVYGTRPEAIKQIPVVKAIEAKGFRPIVCNTGQHMEMVDQVVDLFHTKYDYNLGVMNDKKSLTHMTALLLTRIEEVIQKEKPDWIVVQGDTASALAGAMAGFFNQIKVAHVEAGLRTYNRWSPFPEEINRIYISKITDLHFPPTKRAANNIAQEFSTSKSDRAYITGNTVVDALHWIHNNRLDAVDPELRRLVEDNPDDRVILMTSHRRESFGEGIRNNCEAALDLVSRFPDTRIIFPVHLNPRVKKPIEEMLGQHDRIHLVPPVDYATMIFLIKNAYLILSDSGGIQEEAPSFGTPLLVLRDTTERPEAIEAGCAKLVGSVREDIVREATRLLEDQTAYQQMASVANPFGDGTAATQIVEHIVAAQQTA